MPDIIIKGKSSDFNKDRAHSERKRIEQDLREGGIFSKDKMWQVDCKGESDERKRVDDYMKWKDTKGKDGKTNAEKMDRWGELNRQFKENGLEGREHTLDDVRARRGVKYD